MGIKNITNYLQITETISSSGQPEEYQFKDIAKAGFQLVINLAMPNSDNAIPEEGNIVIACQMSYIHVPVPFDAPKANHLRQFIKVMAAFSDKKIWIHCVLNYRVSAFLYQYQRLVNAASAEQAQEVMPPSWEPDEIWKNFMTLSYENIGQI